MTTPTIELKPSSNPLSDAEREAILASPGFGRHFTDHMVTIKWTEGRGWHDAELVPYAPLSIDPANMTLHYAQTIFEGLKAYRQPDGTVATFRPEANAARFQASARRMAMPELPSELFIEACDALIKQDRAWVPDSGEASLYLRPFMFASEVGLGVRPANEFLFIVIASPSRRVLPRWRQARLRLALRGLRPRGQGRHRRGQDRRQLRGLSGRAGPGGLARLRPGGLARRRRAPLDRGDGRDEPVLRVR